MPTKTLQKASDKEVRLANAIAALSEREQFAYRHYVNTGQKSIAEDKADELFRLYQRGQTTLEIQRLFPQYSHAQVVAARVMNGWDDRREIEVKNLQIEVPAKVETTHLQTQELLSNLLHASHRKLNDALMKYIASGDENSLKEAGVNLPTTLRELGALIDMYMKISGTDSKKVDVRVQGGVVHQHQKMKPEEAEKFMDDLLDGPVHDAEFTDNSAGAKPVAQLEAAPPEPVRTPEQMIDVLVKQGMPLARAQQVVGSMKKKADQLGSEIASLVKEVADGNKDPVN